MACSRTLLSLAACLLIVSAVAAELPQKRIAHVIVALADNQYQGIVPIPAAIGNGDDPARNLYWGAGYGLKTYFTRSASWELVSPCKARKLPVLERCIFRKRDSDVYVVADAYRGREIKRAITDFLAFAAGNNPDENADLVAYIGHDGLMDFSLDRYEYAKDSKHREAVIIACASKTYFADSLRWTGAKPLLWTTGLRAPEAYVIESVLTGWAKNETAEQIRTHAAQAYDKYQHCGMKGAMHLFAHGW